MPRYRSLLGCCLLAGVIILVSSHQGLGQNCDLDCRHVQEFYVWANGSAVYYSVGDCEHCVNGGCDRNWTSILGECELDLTLDGI